MSKNLKKVIHICIIITILVAIGFTGVIVVLRYDEKGETNMPFDITKITIVSTTDAKDVEDGENIWNLNICQNNDIYIDIEKNENYKKKSIINKVIINNVKIVKEPKNGEISFYRPSNNKLSTFENIEQYEQKEFEYQGEKTSNIQEMQISNQGGRLAFRCANNNLGTYKSNDEEELDYNKLLDKINMKNDDLEAKISFNIEIVLINKITFKSTIELDIPVGDIVKDGKTSQEITDMDIVFKRTEN